MRDAARRAELVIALKCDVVCIILVEVDRQHYSRQVWRVSLLPELAVIWAISDRILTQVCDRMLLKQIFIMGRYRKSAL